LWEKMQTSPFRRTKNSRYPKGMLAFFYFLGKIQTSPFRRIQNTRYPFGYLVFLMRWADWKGIRFGAMF
jgi:hypothetical protein